MTTDRLGNTTKTASRMAAQRRTERYILQAAARKLLPDERVSICLRYRAPYTERIEIRKAKEAPRAYYGGLITCGSVWTCAVCANRITEQRRKELSAALSGPGADYYPVLITYTLRHNKGHSLDHVLTVLKTAYRKMRSGRWWQAVKREYLIIGSVLALECTHGKNGWHPHAHEIMFLDFGQLANPHAPEDAKTAMQHMVALLDLALSKKWQEISAQYGMKTTLDNGVTVKHADSAVTDYVAKWGHMELDTSGDWTAAHEVTKMPTKKAKNGGRSPMQLLADFAYNDDKDAGRLFVEYVRAFKGKKQLQYTRGLKRKLGLQSVSDESIAADEETPYDVLAKLDIDQWRTILANDARAEVLNVAAEGDVVALHKYLDTLPGMDNTRMFYD